MPSILGLYDVIVLEKDNKKYIKVIIARENERPYYLKGLLKDIKDKFIKHELSDNYVLENLMLYEYKKRNIIFQLKNFMIVVIMISIILTNL